MSESTLDSQKLDTRSVRPSENTTYFALVLLWSLRAPERVGELFWIPSHPTGRTYALGRSLDAARGGLTLYRQRPGTSEQGNVSLFETGPLRDPSISRRQLEIEVVSAEALEVTNLGRRRLLINGQETRRAEVRVGDVLELHNHLVLLCTRRDARLSLWPSPQKLPNFPWGQADEHGLVGESPAIWELRRQIALMAHEDSHVIIHGPSGAGKELVARALHARSPRGHRPLISRNAATFPETLIEAELFGNAKGFPDSGHPERHGLVGAAQGSHLFLDEIGDLSVAMQARLLRLMDEGEFNRLGDPRPRRADVRLIVATHRPLDRLRPDFLARFRGRLRVPGLNARLEDTPLLTAHLMRQMAENARSTVARFVNPDTDQLRIAPLMTVALARYTYTTHVRELARLLQRSARDSLGEFLAPSEDLLENLHQPTESQPTASPEREERLQLALPDPDDRHRLRIQRDHHFSATRLGRSSEYPVGRHAATRHLRVFIARALSACNWDRRDAIALLAGSDDASAEAHRSLTSTVARFLDNLSERLDADGRDELEVSLRRTYTSQAEVLLDLVEALASGRLPLDDESTS